MTADCPYYISLPVLSGSTVLELFEDERCISCICGFSICEASFPKEAILLGNKLNEIHENSNNYKM